MIEQLTFKFSGRYGNNIVQLINALHIHLNRPNSFLAIPNTRKHIIKPKIIDKYKNYHNICNKIDFVFNHTKSIETKFLKSHINNIYYWNKNQIKYDTKYITFEERVNQSTILTKEILDLQDIQSPYDDNLLIHIRSTDIYKAVPCRSYSQPPIAFYHKVIEDHNFNHFYIISDNVNNFVAQILRSDYGNKITLIEEPNTVKAFNILRNAKNICTSTSSFCTLSTLIKPINNIKNIYTYEYLCYKPGVWHYNFMFDGILKRPTYNFIIYRIDNYPFMQKINNEFIGNWSFTPSTQKLMESFSINNISKVLDHEYR